MKIVFIGGGKMAEAIIAGILESRVCETSDISVCDVDADRRAYLSATYAVDAVEQITSVSSAPDVVFLAVKPQVLDVVLGAIAADIPPSALVISIAAGRSLAQIEASVDEVKAVRVMPNLAASVGSSMNVYCCNDLVTDADQVTVQRLLAAFGEVAKADESLFDAVTAVSGSGPAYVAYLVSALADAGRAQGLSDEQAHTLALQTFLGTAQVLHASGDSPEALITSVSSPNGTTVAGMAVLRESGVREILADTVAAAARRSQELREG